MLICLATSLVPTDPLSESPSSELIQKRPASPVWQQPIPQDQPRNRQVAQSGVVDAISLFPVYAQPHGPERGASSSHCMKPRSVDVRRCRRAPGCRLGRRRSFTEVQTGDAGEIHGEGVS